MLWVWNNVKWEFCLKRQERKEGLPSLDVIALSSTSSVCKANIVVGFCIQLKEGIISSASKRNTVLLHLEGCQYSDFD